MKKDDQKKILEETIKDDNAKEKKDDGMLKDGKMTQAEHDRLKKELDQGIKASKDQEKKLKNLMLLLI